MTLATVLDAGPLVAFLAERESHFKWAQTAFKTARPPMITCEAALTEACFLLRGSAGIEGIFHLLNRGLIKVDFSLSEQIESVSAFMSRYQDRGVSLADACLVRLSEIHENCRVMTLDRDFLLYRRFGRRQIPLIAPFA